VTESWWWTEQWERSRQGAHPIVVEFDEGEARGLLYDRGTPKTVAAFREKLPLTIAIVHVAWSGDMVMGAARIDLGLSEQEDATRLPRPGDLGYDPKFRELTLTYGTAECRLPSGPNTISVFGQFSEQLSALADYCRRRRFQGIGELRFREGT
jgi:hypothetical protein